MKVTILSFVSAAVAAVSVFTAGCVHADTGTPVTYGQLERLIQAVNATKTVSTGTGGTSGGTSGVDADAVRAIVAGTSVTNAGAQAYADGKFATKKSDDSAQGTVGTYVTYGTGGINELKWGVDYAHYAQYAVTAGSTTRTASLGIQNLSTGVNKSLSFVDNERETNRLIVTNRMEHTGETVAFLSDLAGLSGGGGGGASVNAVETSKTNTISKQFSLYDPAYGAVLEYDTVLEDWRMMGGSSFAYNVYDDENGDSWIYADEGTWMITDSDHDAEPIASKQDITEAITAASLSVYDKTASDARYVQLGGPSNSRHAKITTSLNAATSVTGQYYGDGIYFSSSYGVNYLMFPSAELAKYNELKTGGYDLLATRPWVSWYVGAHASPVSLPFTTTPGAGSTILTNYTINVAYATDAAQAGSAYSADSADALTYYVPTANDYRTITADGLWVTRTNLTHGVAVTNHLCTTEALDFTSNNTTLRQTINAVIDEIPELGGTGNYTTNNLTLVETITNVVGVSHLSNFPSASALTVVGISDGVETEAVCTNRLTFVSDPNSNVKFTVTDTGNGNVTISVGVYYK